MLSADELKYLGTLLSAHVGEEWPSLQVAPVTGGSIHEAYRLTAGSRSFFLKRQNPQAPSGLLQAEQDGLDLLLQHSSFHIPKVMGSGTFQERDYLLLEWLTLSRPAHERSWSDFGERLADLHRATQSTFGWDRDNFIGTLPQSNTPHENWVSFWVEERLEPQLALARDAGWLDKQDIKTADAWAVRLEQWIPHEPPALLHGDLWSGNVGFLQDGTPAVFDPAVYFGHRETDLAMTTLFGGFDRVCYDRYAEVFPLEFGWQDRLEIHNLYPLLVHLNLFGAGYRQEVRNLLCKYI